MNKILFKVRLLLVGDDLNPTLIAETFVKLLKLEALKKKYHLPRSSSPNDNCQLHLKTRFQRLKTCFHCHSVFIVHTNCCHL
jgi:hypothetical protein